MAQTTLLRQSVCGFSQVTNETVIILHNLDHWVLAGFIGGVVFVGDSLDRGFSSNVGKQLN